MISSSFLLDFTTGALDSRVTFTRLTDAAHPATFVNSSGYITAATNNQARFDYNPSTLICNGFLIEESRANLCLQSEDFSTSWLANSATVIQNQAVSPANTLTADLVYPTSTGNFRWIYQAITQTSGVIYTQSIYAKSAGMNWLLLSLPNASGSGLAYFDVSNGVVGAVRGGATAEITNAGSGWFKCTVTYTADTGYSYMVAGPVDGNGNTTATSSGTNGIYLWGAQLEAGSSATSYIPTTTTAMTRNADVAAITGTNFSDLWNVGFGGATVQVLPSTVSGIRPLLQFDDGTANEIIALRGNTTNPELYIVDGGTPQAQVDAGTIAANTAYSLTGWWQTNFCAARKDNGARVEDLTATIPTVTQARLGSDGTNYLNGHLATINYYDQFSGQIYTRRKNKAVFTVI